MKITRSMLIAAAIAAISSQLAVRSYAGLFKIDFGQLENERIPVDADGNPTGDAPAALTNWNVIPTWTFADPNALVVAGSASLSGTANAAGTEVTWKLTDFSSSGNNNVTLTIKDNEGLTMQNSFAVPTGMTANNPTKEGQDVVYDGIVVPHVVKDDYLYRAPCPAGSEMLFRIANLAPGTYNVTVFMGRTTDNDGQFGKIWVDDINGAKEPATQNTGDFGSKNHDTGVVYPGGIPQTVTVTIKAGDYLWYGYMEDSTGGISGMIINPVTNTPPPPPASSTGLFKIDFGQLENERVPVDADQNPTGDAPATLTDWNVIPTWTFTDPAANVTAGSASVTGTANAAGTEVTWKLSDFSKSGNDNVTLTISDNAALNAANSIGDAGGMTANNPTKEGLDVVYDGVLVPHVVKDDYLYRAPCPAGSEMLFRFANIKPGKYNVTVFMGRTTDGDGQFGKVWVDDVNGKNEPATENTGDFGSRDRVAPAGIPQGVPRTVTVDIKAGDYLWYGYMEDSTGGISGMIIRGIVGGSASSVQLVASATVNGTYAAASDAKIDSASKSITVPATGSARFFRVQGSTKITSTSVSNGVLTIKYQ